MSSATIKTNSPPVSLAEIAEFEFRRKLNLPQAYREFLAKHNGGEPTPDRLIVSGWHGVSTCINCFFGLGEGGYYDLEACLENSADYIPPDTLPIAVDSGGNMLCLIISGERAGVIGFWDHESPEANNSKSLIEVASGIEALLSKLASESLS